MYKCLVLLWIFRPFCYLCMIFKYCGKAWKATSVLSNCATNLSVRDLLPFYLFIVVASLFIMGSFQWEGVLSCGIVTGFCWPAEDSKLKKLSFLAIRMSVLRAGSDPLRQVGFWSQAARILDCFLLGQLRLTVPTLQSLSENSVKCRFCACILNARRHFKKWHIHYFSLFTVTSLSSRIIF